jgi:hypothetical protein
MEKHLGRYLTEDETVDHIDGNFLNNDQSNLRVLGRSVHASIDAKRLVSQEFVCPECSKKFSKEGRKLHDIICDRRSNKAGPFCSRSCAGKYSQKVQMGQKRLPVTQVTPSYTKSKFAESPCEETRKVDDPNSGKP